MSRPGFKRVAPFDPTQISNCCLWLDASDTTTLTLSGTNVTQWRDKSGSNNHGTGVNNPTYSNGTINFLRSANRKFTLPNGALPSGSSQYAYFLTCSFTDPSITYSLGTNGLINGGSLTGGDDNNTFTLYAYTDSGSAPGNFGMGWGNYGNSYTSSVSYNSNTLVAHTLLSPSNVGLFVNGNPSPTNGPTWGGPDRNQGNGNNVIGAGYAGNNSHSGTISEVIVFSNALTTSQRQQVEGYLAQKWGLKNMLPSNHAGKTGIIYPTVRRSGTANLTTTTLPYYTQFSPLSIAGCQIWLDAADRSATSMTFSSGSNLLAWKDKSGFANTFTLTTGTTTSSNDGGYNIVTFPSGALMSSANQISYTTSSAFFLVSKVTNTGYFSYVLGFTNILSGDYGIKFLYGILTGTPGSEQYAGEFGSSNFYVNGSFNPNFGSNYYTNVYSIIDIVSPRGSGTSYVTLSDDFYGRYFAGNIAEFLYYPAGVTSAQRQTIESYLSQKWGVPLVVAPTIPAGVPDLVSRLVGNPQRNLRVAKTFGYNSTYNPNPPVLSAGLLTGTSANYLFAITLDATGSNIYYTGRNTANVWKMPVATLTSALWAGGGGLTYGAAGRDGAVGTAQLYAPVQLAFDTIGNMYVADSYDGRIRKIDYSNQYMTSMAGNPSSLVCCNGDGTGTGAGMCYPGGVTVDGSNNVYFYDYHRVRTVTQAGVVSTIAGDSTVSSSGFVNATGASAKFSFASGGPPPSKLTCDKVNGFLYVNDVGNSVVRKIVISTGVVTTYIAAQAGSLYCDAVGNLFVCLSSGVWVYTPTGVSTLLAAGSYYNDNVDMTISPDNTTIYLAYATASQIKRIVLGSIMV